MQAGTAENLPNRDLPGGEKTPDSIHRRALKMAISKKTGKKREK
jgi:hypothetical protein